MRNSGCAVLSRIRDSERQPLLLTTARTISKYQAIATLVFLISQFLGNETSISLPH